MKGRRDTTITTREYVLGRLSSRLGIPLLDATEADLLAWRASLSRLGHATINAEVGHVRGFYAWAVRHAGLAASPAADIPVPPMPEYEPRPISEEDLLTAVEGAPGRIRIWLVLGAWCGMRCVEIAFLRRQLVREHDEPARIIIAPDATKGGRRGRTIHLCPFAAGEITEAGLPASGWAFPRLDGRAGHVSAHLVSNVVNRYLHERGITDTFHATRHRFGTELLSASDGNLRLVQEEMGHKNPKTTSKYTLVKDGPAVAAVGRLPVPRGLRHAGLTGHDQLAA